VAVIAGAKLPATLNLLAHVANARLAHAHRRRRARRVGFGGRATDFVDAAVADARVDELAILIARARVLAEAVHAQLVRAAHRHAAAFRDGVRVGNARALVANLALRAPHAARLCAFSLGADLAAAAIATRRAFRARVRVDFANAHLAREPAGTRLPAAAIDEALSVVADFSHRAIARVFAERARAISRRANLVLRAIVRLRRGRAWTRSIFSVAARNAFVLRVAIAAFAIGFRRALFGRSGILIGRRANSRFANRALRALRIVAARRCASVVRADLTVVAARAAGARLQRRRFDGRTAVAVAVVATGRVAEVATASRAASRSNSKCRKSEARNHTAPMLHAHECPFIQGSCQ